MIFMGCWPLWPTTGQLTELSGGIFLYTQATQLAHAWKMMPELCAELYQAININILNPDCQNVTRIFFLIIIFIKEKKKDC